MVGEIEMIGIARLDRLSAEKRYPNFKCNRESFPISVVSV
jgi:hypothetical protein